MAQFSVKTRQALSQAEEERKMAGELGEYEEAIRNAANRLSFRSSALGGIQARLRATADQVGAQRMGMAGMSSALSSIMQSYDRTEQRIYSNAGGKGNLQMKEIAASIIDGFRGEEKDIENFIKNLITTIKGSEPAEWLLERIEEYDQYVAEIIQNGAVTPGLLLMLPKLLIDSKETYDGFLDKVKDSIEEATGFDVNVSKEGALYSKEIRSKHGSLGVSALAYEAYAGAEGGLFERDEDGNLVFNPNISAKAGASVTAFQAAAAYAVGNQLLGADINGNITAGKAGAEISAQAGLRDDEGNFNPHAKLDASAEAILVDAKASAGVTVLGTRADVTGSVNVGVGAHANIEVGNGKVACDIGASLGVGVSLKFTIDYSGTINAVRSAAKSVVKDLWKRLTVW